MEDISTLHRGQPWWGPTRNLASELKEMSTLGKIAGLSGDDLSRLSGKWWTADTDYARQYAKGTGKIRSIKLQPGDMDKIKKFGETLSSKGGKYSFLGLGKPFGSQNQYLLPESILKNRTTGINIGQTLKSLGAHYGGQGLRYGAQGLGYLASLPAQAALMTLYTTPANADEEDMTAEDFRRLAMKEVAGVRFHSKRRNIPGTPLVRTGDGSVEKTITRNFVPSGGGGGWSPSGADLSPGGGYGQSPTGSDIAGTPFSRGGILGAF